MALDESVREAWEKAQALNSEPVNALGVPIRGEQEALRVWKEEGIDKFLQD